MFKFTSHAIQRYCERVEPGLRYNKALKKLETLAAGASPKKMQTEAGQQQWLVNDPPCALVVKRVKDKSLKCNINLVVTVLGEDEMEKWGDPDVDPYEYERELLAEYEADLQARQQRTQDSAVAMKAEGEASKKAHAKKGYDYDPSKAVFAADPVKKLKTQANDVRWTEVLAMIASEHKAFLKYESHRETIRKSMDETADALREALKTLHDMAGGGSHAAHECLERISTINPRFIKTGYIFNTTMENRRFPRDS